MPETLAAFSAFYRDECNQTADGRVICRACGGDIHRVRGFMLLHDEQYGEACAGPGRTLRMDIPFCPTCEGRPAEYGCIHITASDFMLPSVVDASRPFGAAHPLCRQAAPLFATASKPGVAQGVSKVPVTMAGEEQPQILRVPPPN